MKGNVLVIHGGGPTPVINASLYGVLEEAKENGNIEKVYGAVGGTQGVLNEDFVDLMKIPEEEKERLLFTPASVIGSSRFALEEEDYEKMPAIFRKYGIRFVLLNGGNGTMDTCGKISRVCGQDIKVVGIPKTIDNDIAVTDHTPGYGSAARYLAGTVKEVSEDVRSLPIHVCVIEAMGRNAGWLTAASVLARKDKGDAPHLIYLPERPFDEEEFLEDVREVYDRLGYAVVVASEGLKNKDGEPIVEPVFKTERAVYYGDVGSYLAMLVIRRLGIKARSEKPGICGRASIPWQSETDRREAVLAGREALRAAVEGESGVMIGFKRVATEDGGYETATFRVPIEEVMMYEKKLPETYINDRGNDITDEFAKWCQPLIGGELPQYICLKDYEKEEKR